MKSTLLSGILFCFVAIPVFLAYAEEPLNLPDLLTTEDGKKVDSAATWRDVRRPEILELFKSEVYGRAPVERPDDLSFKVVDVTPDMMNGAATRKLVDISYGGPGDEGTIRLIIFQPNKAPKPAPGFLLICNRGKENIDPTRQKKDDFWPAEEIVARGYVAATFSNADVDPDNFDHFKNGVHGIFDPPDKKRAPDAWATITAWAWGASRCMDYFESDADIDAGRIAVVGHSRGGKTALWCGARDQRFAMACSNDSGCTGAALARRKQGERVADINKHFPHWFCENYNKYNGKEEELPVDQHMLVALMAPRPVCVASASEDAWADPKGEFLSCVYASPAWRLYGLPGLCANTMPKPNHAIQIGYISYHLRKGKHDLTMFDWERYLDFADKRMK